MAVVVCVSVPIFAVIVTWKMPGLGLLQESAAVCGVVPKFIVDGVIVLHVSPDGTLSVRDMVPANPLSVVRVIVEIEETPGLAVGREAVIVKSE